MGIGERRWTQDKDWCTATGLYNSSLRGIYGAIQVYHEPRSSTRAFAAALTSSFNEQSLL